MFVHGVWIGLCMSILIRDQRSTHAIYYPLDDADPIAIEPAGSIFDPQIDAIGPSPDVIILSDDAGHSSDSPDDDAGSWLRSWSQSGWERFDQAFRDARELVQSKDAQLVIRSSSSGMLSDAVCTLNWCTRGGGQDTKILLDPMGWIVPSMMRDLEDHLDRIVELCQEMIAHRRVWGIVVRSIAWNEDRSGLVPSSMSAGEPDEAMLGQKLNPLLANPVWRVVWDESDIARIHPDASIES